MVIDPVLNKVFTAIALADISKDAIAAGLPTCEDLEDLFTDLAAEKNKLEATFCLVVDTNVVSDIDIRLVLFIFDWFIATIVDPNFVWSNFSRSVYISDKRARAVIKHAPTTPTTIATSPASISSSIYFSTGVLAADATRQATPTVPDMVATLKPCSLWTPPPCVAN
jgi:hypothetical protein